MYGEKTSMTRIRQNGQKSLISIVVPKQRQEPFSSKYPFLSLVLNKKGEHAEYHDIFVLFKPQLYSKQ